VHSPILDAGAGVEELRLGVHGDALGRHLVDLDDRRVANCFVGFLWEGKMRTIFNERCREIMHA
jgi:hypothetical protein